MTQHWITQGVIYEIFVRMFSDRGNFQGVEDRLEDLSALGVTTLWFMPIHPIGVIHRKGSMGSPYSVQDYTTVDSRYGSETDFQRLIKRAHALGFRVIIDWVANHCAWDNPIVASNPNWLHHDEAGSVLDAGHGWTDTAWLDHTNPELEAFLLKAMERWVVDFDIDGFRCDVADLVNVEFWEQARRLLEHHKPDIGLVAEAYSPPLMQEAFNLAYDIPWYWSIRRATKERSIQNIWTSHHRFHREFPPDARPLRYLENHDKERFIALFGALATRTAATLLFTSEGVPLLLNGQEIGEALPTRDPALFEEGSIRWNAEVVGMRDYYKELIRLRRLHPALVKGSTTIIESNNPHVIVYIRSLADSEILVALNFSSINQSVRISEDKFPVHQKIILRTRSTASQAKSPPAIDLNFEPWGTYIATT